MTNTATPQGGDIALTELVPFSRVPRLLPKKGSGKHVHISQIYRWAFRGLRGKRLRAMRVGGSWHTSEEWLTDFFEQISGPGSTSQPTPTPRRRQRQLASVEAALREEGL